MADIRFSNFTVFAFAFSAITAFSQHHEIFVGFAVVPPSGTDTDARQAGTSPACCVNR
jgi:hypothetical protein